MRKGIERRWNEMVLSNSIEFLELVKGLNYVRRINFGRIIDSSNADSDLEINSIGYDDLKKSLKLVISSKSVGRQGIYVLLEKDKVPQLRKDIVRNGYNFIVN